MNKVKVEERKVYENYARELEANVNFFQIELQEKYKLIRDLLPESSKHLMEDLDVNFFLNFYFYLL